PEQGGAAAEPAQGRVRGELVGDDLEAGGRRGAVLGAPARGVLGAVLDPGDRGHDVGSRGSPLRGTPPQRPCGAGSLATRPSRRARTFSHPRTREEGRRAVRRARPGGRTFAPPL